MPGCARWIVALLLLSTATAAGQEAGIVVSEAFLPAAGAAYHGGTHLFPDRDARLTCSSHGVFSGSVTPPRGPGMSSVVDYHATFTGELALGPSADETVYAIAGRVHMAERITFAERRGRESVFETEMVVLDLQGAGLPEGVMVRESPSRVSAGRATVTTLARGRQRIESHYDVWLELSTDGGRSWSLAESSVRMTLVPAVAPRRMIAPGR